MPHIDEPAKDWQIATAKRIGKAVAEARERLDLTAAKLAERTRDLGYPIHRTAITKIENGSRSGKLDVSELVVLAAALGVPPVELIFPAMPTGPVEILPGVEVPSSDAMLWFAGERMSVGVRKKSIPVTVPELAQATRTYANALQAFAAAHSRLDNPEMHPYDDTSEEALRQDLSRIQANLAQARDKVLAAGGVVDDA
ncbi:helix-turn-helix domain-containing protein [Nocardia sp. GTS18]|uniref:helix-turn-helix domain-containing protein n=1 Tax=Nocardia sp. GTS18 TaxID=1778064 RepID=UPI0015EE75BB|nr:helix-turn-helix transcriptional regulator [Nocardia sp. GTS18]